MQKEALIDYWIKSGLVTNKRVIDAFRAVPRELFVLEEYKDSAYEDIALPIMANQTISQPTTVMIMTQALGVEEGQKVLEVGTGSGYQAAILSRLVGKKGVIYTTELIEELAGFAKKNLEEAGIKNVRILKTDGSMGYKPKAPYDRIIVTAASPDVPKALVLQLKKNGMLVIPVGSLYAQKMLKVWKNGKTEDLGEFQFVPLKGKYGHKMEV